MASQSEYQSALLLTEAGKPLIKSSIPVEDPEEGLVQVKIAATSLVPADYKIRDHGAAVFGLTLPMVLGFEVAGRITSSPLSTSSSSSSSLLPIGTRIAFQTALSSLTGGLKEYAAADPALVLRVPDHLSDEQAATLGCNPFTAAMALFHPESGFGLPLPGSAAGFDYAGVRLVVLGGTAIGKFAVQQARLAGVGTIVVVASPASLGELEGYGATHGVDRHLPAGELAAQVRDAVGHGGEGDGGDESAPLFVFDAYNVPDTSLVPSLFAASGRRGIVVMASPVAPRDDAALAAAGAEVRTFRAWLAGQRALADAWLPLFNGWLAEGRIMVPPFRVVPFEAGAVNEALDEIKKGSTGVKYVVRIGSE